MPLGLKNDKLYNKDVSYTVKGHFEYKKNLQTILKKIRIIKDIFCQYSQNHIN